MSCQWTEAIPGELERLMLIQLPVILSQLTYRSEFEKYLVLFEPEE